MKKWIIIAGVALVAVVGVMGGMSAMGVSANDSALEEIRGQEGVIALSVSGMT